MERLPVIGLPKFHWILPMRWKISVMFKASSDSSSDPVTTDTDLGMSCCAEQPRRRGDWISRSPYRALWFAILCRRGDAGIGALVGGDTVRGSSAVAESISATPQTSAASNRLLEF